MLHRLVRRPLIQLKPGTPARAVAERSAAHLFENAQIALELHPRILEIGRLLANLQARFGATFPHMLADHVSAAGITENAVASIRATADVERLEQRIARVTFLLQEDADAVERSSLKVEIEQGDIDSEALITITELIALRESAVRRRRIQSTASQTLSMAAGQTAATAMEILDAQTPTTAPNTSPTAGVVEHLAARAVSRWTQGLALDATDYMTGVLSASANGMLPTVERFIWRPPIGSLRLAVTEIVGRVELEADESTFYSIPLGKDFVLFSKKSPSVVRLYSRALRIGEIVECTARPIGELDTLPATTADFDLRAQFDGLDQIFSRWYRADSRSEVRVIARCGDEWFGRIQKQGHLDCLKEPASIDRPPLVGAFRILRPPTITPPLEDGPTAAEAMVTGPPRVLLGLKSTPVSMPFSGQRSGLARSFSGRSKKGVDAVERERAFLSQLDTARKLQRIPGISTTSHIGYVSLPRARGTGKVQAWPCYAMPLAVWEPDYDRTWLQGDLGNTIALLGSVARIVCAANDLGFSIGAFGFQSFAIGIGWRRPNCNPRPEALLVSAPTVCRMGERYYDPSDKDLAIERHRHVGVALAAQLEERKTAAATVDAACFAMFALDMLVKDSVQAERTYVAALASAAHGDFTFSFSDVAERLLLAICAPDGDQRILRSMRVLADPKLKLRDWMNSLSPT